MPSFKSSPNGKRSYSPNGSKPMEVEEKWGEGVKVEGEGKWGRKGGGGGTGGGGREKRTLQHVFRSA